MRDAAVEVPPRRAEAEVGEQLLEQQLERAAVDVALGLDRAVLDAAERVEIERDELDGGDRRRPCRTCVRVIELKKVFVNSVSGSASMQLGEAPLDRAQSARVVRRVAEPSRMSRDRAR